MPLGNKDNDLLSDTHLRSIKQEIKAWLMRWRREEVARLHWASLHTYQPGRVKGGQGPRKPRGPGERTDLEPSSKGVSPRGVSGLHRMSSIKLKTITSPARPCPPRLPLSLPALSPEESMTTWWGGWGGRNARREEKRRKDMVLLLPLLCWSPAWGKGRSFVF